jgi:hypothetical protein
VVVTVFAAACWVIVDRQRLIRERDAAKSAATNSQAETAEIKTRVQAAIQSERQMWEATDKKISAKE